MNNLYNTNLDEVKKEAWVKGFKAGKSTVDEWQALERIKAKVFEEGYEKGYADAQAGYRKGRQAGFRAGFEAATGQPQAKIEAAYEQGYRAGAMSPQEDAALDELLSPSNTKESS